jgi:hypothetical protein
MSTKVRLACKHGPVLVTWELWEDGVILYQAYGPPDALIAAGIMERSGMTPMPGGRHHPADSRGIVWCFHARGPNQPKWKLSCHIDPDATHLLPGIPGYVDTSQGTPRGIRQPPGSWAHYLRLA